MKRITLLLLLCFIGSLSYAQMGIGLGNGGLNIKSDHQKKFGVIGRVGMSVATSPFNFSISPNVSGVFRLFTSDNAKPYIGLGVGASYFSASKAFGYNTFIPVGVEVFPMGNKRMSFTVESGVGMAALNSSFIYSGFRGLLEFTFYFGGE